MATGWTESEKYNWDDIPDEPPAAPENGLYVAKIEIAKAELTKKNRLPSVELELELLNKYGNSDPLTNVSTKIRFENLVLSKNAAFRVKQAAKSAGVKPPATSSQDDVHAFAERLLGAEVIVRIAQSTSNQGKTFAGVVAYLTKKQAEETQDGERPSARTRRGRT